MDKNKIISEYFNTEIQAAFDKYLEENTSGDNCEIQVDQQKLINDIESKWLDKTIAEIGMTPRQYIQSLADLDELLECFIYISAFSDVGVPEFIINELKNHGDIAGDKLLSFIRESMNSDDQMKIIAVSQAIYAVGCLKYEKHKQQLINLLFDSVNNDMLSEVICAAIVEYQAFILPDVINAFNNTKVQEIKEHLLTCVSEISRKNRSDEVFYFFKNAFRVLKNLKLVVEVLGDYGDGRAIPLLRGYILKNKDEIDKATFDHIRAIIKKLGGEIDDLIYEK